MQVIAIILVVGLLMALVKVIGWIVGLALFFQADRISAWLDRNSSSQARDVSQWMRNVESSISLNPLRVAGVGLVVLSASWLLADNTEIGGRLASWAGHAIGYPFLAVLFFFIAYKCTFGSWRGDAGFRAGVNARRWIEGQLIGPHRVVRFDC